MSKKRSPAQRAIDVMLEGVRDAVGRCRGTSEREVLEALLAEAEGWKMRLREVEQEEGEV